MTEEEAEVMIVLGGWWVRLGRNGLEDGRWLSFNTQELLIGRFRDLEITVQQCAVAGRLSGNLETVKRSERLRSSPCRHPC